MSYHEAKEDGILIGRDYRGFTEYRPSCAMCGQPVRSWSYQRSIRYTCAACKNKLQSADLQKERTRVHISAHEIT